MLKKFHLTVVSYVKEKPLLVIYSLIGTGIFTELFSLARYGSSEPFTSLSYAFVLALALCLGGDYLFQEKPKFKKALPVFVAGLFALGYAIAKAWGDLPQFQLHIFLTSYLLFLLAPKVVRERESVGFHWVVSVLYAVGTSIFISAVLLGLVTFLVWIVKELFGIELAEYLKHFGLAFFTVLLPINIFALFAPKPEQVPSVRYEMPSLLEKTVKFLFIPVMLVYIAVLLVYALKILFKFELPVGMVSVPISIAYGMYFLLNAYLESQGRENEGLWKFHKWIELSFIPLFIMMGVGVSKRILEYGFTTDRVYLVMGFVVILGSYFVRLIYKRLELRKLVALGAVIMFLTSYGPLNPVSVSVTSQTKRFLAIIQNYKPSFQKLADFKLSDWKQDDIDAASSSLNYIIGHKGTAVLKAAGLKNKVFVTSLEHDSLEFSLDNDLNTSLNNVRSIDYHSRRHKKEDGATKDDRVCKAFELPFTARKDLLVVTAFDWAYTQGVYSGKVGVQNLPDKNVYIKMDIEKATLSVVKDNNEAVAIEFGNPVREQVPKTAAGKIEEPLELVGTAHGYRIKMLINEAKLDCRDPSVEAKILVKKL